MERQPRCPGSGYLKCFLDPQCRTAGSTEVHISGGHGKILASSTAGTTCIELEAAG